MEEPGETDPAPFSVMVTLVALPPKVLPEMVTGAVPQVLPVVSDSVSRGGFTQPQLTENSGVVAVHPAGLRTVTRWLPLATLLKTLLSCQAPLLSLYSNPAPEGDVTVTIARLTPPWQLTETTGMSGTGSGELMVNGSEATDTHPDAAVTV